MHNEKVFFQKAECLVKVVKKCFFEKTECLASTYKSNGLSCQNVTFWAQKVEINGHLESFVHKLRASYLILLPFHFSVAR